jgi:hypothetical protein
MSTDTASDTASNHEMELTENIRKPGDKNVPPYTPPSVDVGDTVLIFTDFRPDGPDNPGTVATVSRVSGRKLDAFSVGAKFMYQGLHHRRDPIHSIRRHTIKEAHGVWDLGPQSRRVLKIEKEIDALKVQMLNLPGSGDLSPEVLPARRGPGRPKNPVVMTEIDRFKETIAKQVGTE